MPEPLDLDILPSSENIPMKHEVFEVKILSFLLDDKNAQDLKNAQNLKDVNALWQLANTLVDIICGEIPSTTEGISIDNFDSAAEARALLKIVNRFDSTTIISFLSYVKAIYDVRSVRMQIMNKNVLNNTIDTIISNILLMVIFKKICDFDDNYAIYNFIYPKSSNTLNNMVLRHLRNRSLSITDINSLLVQLNCQATNSPIESLLLFINYHYVFIYYYLYLINCSQEPSEEVAIGFSDDNINLALDKIFETSDRSKWNDLVSIKIREYTEILSKISKSNMKWLEEASVPPMYLPMYNEIKESIIKRQAKTEPVLRIEPLNLNS